MMLGTVTRSFRRTWPCWRACIQARPRMHQVRTGLVGPTGAWRVCEGCGVSKLTRSMRVVEKGGTRKATLDGMLSVTESTSTTKAYLSHALPRSYPTWSPTYIPSPAPVSPHFPLVPSHAAGAHRRGPVRGAMPLSLFSYGEAPPSTRCPEQPRSTESSRCPICRVPSWIPPIGNIHEERTKQRIL